MAATIELKYYNSFWLKKIKSITDVNNSTAVFSSQVDSAITIATGLGVDKMNVGQKVFIEYGSEVYNGHIIERVSNDTFIVNPEPSPVITGTPNILLGPIKDFTNIPKAYTGSSATPNEDWYIEEARIRGGYNNTTVDFGVKAYAVDASKKAETRSNALIYSGVYNSRTGINNTNQFSVAQDITKGVDPAYGSIQKLYAEDTNLIIFQENKVSRALIDKDAIYSAEGGGTVTSSNAVIGQIIPYAGEYGISTDPESFAVYGYRKYFTDRRRNAVLRLSMDGIEEISRYGMTDFFRDTFSSMSANGKIVGGYDLHTKKYDLCIHVDGQYDGLFEFATPYQTLAFDESVKGWVSFYTYKPDWIASLKNKFYSFAGGGSLQNGIWEHYDDRPKGRGVFYGDGYPALVTFIFNVQPSTVKNFKTINYEGSSGWEVYSITTNEDTGNFIFPYEPQATQSGLENSLFSNRFARKEDKYFANIINSTPQNNGEIVFGRSMTGVKGFFATVQMKYGYPFAPKELFAVSTEYSQSSY